jgi:hypothetical protein
LTENQWCGKLKIDVLRLSCERPIDMSSGSYEELLKRARQELSRTEQLDLSDALRKSTESSNGTDSKRSLLQALVERGIIGSIADAPADLGTNPRYMEGFGRNEQ